MVYKNGKHKDLITGILIILVNIINVLWIDAKELKKYDKKIGVEGIYYYLLAFGFSLGIFFIIKWYIKRKS